MDIEVAERIILFFAIDFAAAGYKKINLNSSCCRRVGSMSSFSQLYSLLALLFYMLIALLSHAQ